jgi:hypothetical protein
MPGLSQRRGREGWDVTARRQCGHGVPARDDRGLPFVRIESDAPPAATKRIERPDARPVIPREDHDVVDPPEVRRSRRADRIVPDGQDGVGEHRGRRRSDREPFDAVLAERPQPGSDLRGGFERDPDAEQSIDDDVGADRRIARTDVGHRDPSSVVGQPPELTRPSPSGRAPRFEVEAARRMPRPHAARVRFPAEAPPDPRRRRGDAAGPSQLVGRVQSDEPTLATAGLGHGLPADDSDVRLPSGRASNERPPSSR